MKSVSVLMSNFNSHEAVQLAVESVRRYTLYPDYRLIVYDDRSTNDVDVPYLREAKRRGLITELIEGKRRSSHGAALNVLMGTCETDLAMVLDCDVEIIREGWLKNMVDCVNDSTLAVLGIEDNYPNKKPSLPSWFQSWFMLWNMAAYRDGMEADWRTASVQYGGASVFCPTGGRIWLNQQQANPRRYAFVPLPKSVKRKFRHVAHISVLGDLRESDPEKLHAVRRKKLSVACERLELLRADVKGCGHD